MLAVFGEVDGLLGSCVPSPHHCQILAPEAAAGTCTEGHVPYAGSAMLILPRHGVLTAQQQGTDPTPAGQRHRHFVGEQPWPHWLQLAAVCGSSLLLLSD